MQLAIYVWCYEDAVDCSLNDVESSGWPAAVVTLTGHSVDHRAHSPQTRLCREKGVESKLPTLIR